MTCTDFWWTQHLNAAYRFIQNLHSDQFQEPSSALFQYQPIAIYQVQQPKHIFLLLEYIPLYFLRTILQLHIALPWEWRYHITIAEVAGELKAPESCSEGWQFCAPPLRHFHLAGRTHQVVHAERTIFRNRIFSFFLLILVQSLCNIEPKWLSVCLWFLDLVEEATLIQLSRA